MVTPESAASRTCLINLAAKQAGKPIAGNRHDGFEVAETGNRLTVRILRHSQRKRGAPARLNLRSTAPVFDPTRDRGLEMAKHKTFTVATNVKVYFCDPHSPWQRGTNENTNRLLRQYLPKRSDLSGYTQTQLDKIALRLNQRPRKTLGFQTPASKLQQSVALTG